MTLLNILGGGIWIIPILCFIAAVAAYLKAKSNQKKGSEWVDKAGVKHYDPLDILPIYKSYYFYGAIFFALCGVLFLIFYR